MELLVPLSPGELVDRLSILEIKAERIPAGPKRSNVQAELERLRPIAAAGIADDPVVARVRYELRAVNERLWDIEDEIRACDGRGEFGPGFIALARAVHQNNDQRARLKRELNEHLGSALVEEKSYGATSRAVEVPARPPAPGRAREGEPLPPLRPMTAAQRAELEENGFLVVRGVLEPEIIERLLPVADRLVEGFDVAGRTGGSDDPRLRSAKSRYVVQRRPGLVQEPEVLALVAHPGMLSLLVQLLSPNIHLHTTALIYKPPVERTPEAERVREWHRDIGIVHDLGHGGLPRVGVKVGYCLTDVLAPWSGMTRFAPGSHRVGTPLVVGAGRVDPPGCVDPLLRAGDAVLFENRVYHTLVPNFSRTTAKLLFLGYSYSWMKADTYLAIPDAELLSRVDPVTHQLLGGSSRAIVEWGKAQGLYPPVRWIDDRGGEGGP